LVFSIAYAQWELEQRRKEAAKKEPEWTMEELQILDDAVHLERILELVELVKLYHRDPAKAREILAQLKGGSKLALHQRLKEQVRRFD
jgi:hypothetical protein